MSERKAPKFYQLSPYNNQRGPRKPLTHDDIAAAALIIRFNANVTNTETARVIARKWGLEVEP